MSGELVAFYQAGYGVAAFGVGPLRDLTGRPLAIIYTVGTLVAAVMLMAAITVVVRGAKARL
jgi:MFS family permease